MSKEDFSVSTIKTKDGASIFYKDWGKGRPIVFSHGWPLNADAWDEQLMFFASRGYRAIAHDRRGHGRSSQTWEGHDMDTYADDLDALIQRLELRNVLLVGHSTGGGEVTRYLGRHGSRAVSKVVLVGAVPPQMLRSEAHPSGLSPSTFDEIRTGLATDRSQFYQDLSAPFFGANREGSHVSQATRDQFWRLSMQASLKAAYDCVQAFSETDFTEDLKKIDVPTLFIHGDDDQIVPIDGAAKLAVKLVKHGTLKVYSGAPHGLMVTHRAAFHSDLIAFAES